MRTVLLTRAGCFNSENLKTRHMKINRREFLIMTATCSVLRRRVSGLLGPLDLEIGAG